MDDRTFDRVTKALAGGLSRRRVVHLVGGGLSGALAGFLGQGAVSEAQGVTCSTDTDCASLNTICATFVCAQGSCRIGTAAPAGTVCGPASLPCVLGQVCTGGICG